MALYGGATHVPPAFRRPMVFLALGFTLGLVAGRLSAPTTIIAAEHEQHHVTEASSPVVLAPLVAPQPHLPSPEVVAVPASADVDQKDGDAQSRSSSTVTSDDGVRVPSPGEASRRFAVANVAGSDKTGSHAYHLMYGPFLAPYLDEPVVVGLGYGLGSAVAKGFKKKVNEKSDLYTGDQADAIFWKKMKEDLGEERFDVIIDDGSHVPWHQVFTLETIFDEWLKPGGLYVIEDTETSYWDHYRARIYGYDVLDAGNGKRGSSVEKMKGIVDVLNRKFLLDPQYSVLKSKVDLDISHIAFSQNCVMMWKKPFPAGDGSTSSAWEKVEALYRGYTKPGMPSVWVDRKLKHFRRYKEEGQHSWELPRGTRGFFARWRGFLGSLTFF